MRTNDKVSGTVVGVSMAIACPLGVLGLGARNTTDSHMEYQAASTRQQRQVSWLQHLGSLLLAPLREGGRKAEREERSHKEDGTSHLANVCGEAC